ncbi:GTPase domain-containing protein [Collimonas sp. OK412]|jgi:energy-coupling factor transporter ATP-binding protein EcfA2|uniref:GTPase domain-containing protein n=1 Tax=Collimonas sp. (strain OK412) TaxID=1801619 RepID=UPI0008F2DB0B|nr:GTPase domain-containing protein [Collimonas sp. OK412]SFB68914.1 hypothetical protein SAMN04515619_1011 [Collimonas sp. OK412]
MRKFVAIIGDRNSGKSTIIKSLTGCRTSSFRGSISDLSTGRSIYVICSSPQEHLLSLADFRKALKTSETDPNCQGIVMAIQPTVPRARLSMEAIFQVVATTANFQMHAFLLDPGRSGSLSNSNAIITRLKSYPTKHFLLNGERFSHINAQIINSKTRIAC